MASLLEIRDARRVFVTPEGGRLAALDGIDLDVGANEFVTLLGPSGCGKTTLLRAISGFEGLDSGLMTLDGADLTALPPFRRPVNTVFQSYALFGHMTVARNVGYALEVAGVAKPVLGGAKGLMIGNLVEQQFLSSRNWPFGSALSMIIMAVVLGVLLVSVTRARKAGGHA